MSQNSSALALALFDFDGVVCHTEAYYGDFWAAQAVRYRLGDEFAAKVKGVTLQHIFSTYFPTAPDVCRQIAAELEAFEQQIPLELLPGLADFVGSLQACGVPTAIATASSPAKMRMVCRRMPVLKTLFPVMITDDCYQRPKPYPDCFLTGMNHFSVSPAQTVVFEDSLNGLRAAKGSGAYVVGVAGTLPAKQVSQLAHSVIHDFTELTPSHLSPLPPH